MKMYVYGLFNALDITQQVFYVGITSNIRQRKSNHTSHGARSVGKHIAKLRAAGSDFSIKVLEVTNDKDGARLEAWWISRLKPEVNFARPAPIVVKLSKMKFHGTLQQIETQAIKAVLKACRNNMSHAAKVLGMGRQTLYNRLSER